MLKIKLNLNLSFRISVTFSLQNDATPILSWFKELYIRAFKKQIISFRILMRKWWKSTKRLSFLVRVPLAESWLFFAPLRLYLDSIIFFSFYAKLYFKNLVLSVAYCYRVLGKFSWANFYSWYFQNFVSVKDSNDDIPIETLHQNTEVNDDLTKIIYK